MRVYIPNMEKPKNCNDCLFQMIDGDFVRNEWLTIESCLIKDDEADDCPLIEIVTCEKCRWFFETNKVYGRCIYGGSSTSYVMPTDFCSSGERRAE